MGWREDRNHLATIINDCVGPGQAATMYLHDGTRVEAFEVHDVIGPVEYRLEAALVRGIERPEGKRRMFRLTEIARIQIGASPAPYLAKDAGPLPYQWTRYARRWPAQSQ